ncbi:unnamed protein product [Adineta ricciae]|uniref:Uncharacterized protein n=1 Tax=Adineta ricciae TaxID=249248 RepID=A0A816ARA8_ADIRI|nr:unnamed protein product [Adineta ricciae]CAF1600838.1 unnamed protein product [Adineta ricciae]
MSATPIYDIARRDVIEYTTQVKNTQGVFSMIHESFEFHFGTYQGISDSDLQTIARRLNDKDLEELLLQTVLAGDGAAKYKDHSVAGEIGFRKVFVAFKKINGKYDIVYCKATQIRRADWGKIGATIGLTSFLGGLVGVGLTFVPIVNVAAAPLILGGAAAGGAAGAAAAGTAAVTQKRDISNVVMGYIGKELSDRNLLRLV